MLENCLPLSLLGCGQSGRVWQVVGRADHVHRLREMGLRDGATIEILQSGRPCIIRIDGQRLCVRDDDLLSVLVRPILAAATKPSPSAVAVEPVS
jgi:Fe2+ transport system protein FeoA